MRTHTAPCTFLVLLLAGYGDQANLPASSGYGPDPKLPQPVESTIPTVSIARADPWTENEKPKAADGFTVAAFARGLDHPRWLYQLPNGDVLVAQSNAPEGSGGRKGIEGYVMGWVKKLAGAGVPSPDKITLLRDGNGDGTAETRTTFISGIKSPFGMALVGSDLYVAATDAILRFKYEPGQSEIKSKGEKVVDLPALPFNHHWTKNILASKDGAKLYVTVGSNSNVAENGIDAEKNRAAIHEVDLATGTMTLFASGLRNPNGMDWNPVTGELWTVVNERDEIGSNLVPDYMTHVQRGGFYGWPYSYYGQHVDSRVSPQKPELVAKAIKPDYALGAHTASLGLTFYTGDALPERYKNGVFVGQHGSWNRKPLAGYKVLFVPFRDGKPAGDPEDVLTGFIGEDGYANGRPVGVVGTADGALLVADDAGNAVWRVTAAPRQATTR